MPFPSVPPDAPLPPHLSADRTIHVIISTLSGNHGAQDYYETHLLPLLKFHSLPHTVHHTSSPRTITQVTATRILPLAIKGVKQTILLLSGDGGIIDIVNTLATNLMRGTSSIFVKPILCVFPLGTANALATSAGIAGDALGVMMRGKGRALPAFEVRVSKGSRLVVDEGRGREHIDGSHDNRTDEEDEEPTIYGAVVFSWGLHASLVAASDTVEYRKHGVERFKMAAGELMRERHLYKGRVRVKFSHDQNKDGNREWQELNYPDPQPNPGSELAEQKEQHLSSILAPLSLTSESTRASTNTANQHVYVLATLVSSLEPGFVISPDTKTPDDTLRLVAITPSPPPPPSLPSPGPTAPNTAEDRAANQPSNSTASTYESELTRILTLAYQQGAHISDASVLYHAINGLRIDMLEPDDEGGTTQNVRLGERWRQICVDGKIIAVEEGGWVEVRMLPGQGVEGRRVVELVVPQ